MWRCDRFFISSSSSTLKDFIVGRRFDSSTGKQKKTCWSLLRRWWNSSLCAVSDGPTRRRRREITPPTLRHQPARLLHDGSIGFGIRWESLAPAALDRLKTWLKAVIFGASIVQARRSQRFRVRITHSVVAQSVVSSRQFSLVWSTRSSFSRYAWYALKVAVLLYRQN